MPSFGVISVTELLSLALLHIAYFTCAFTEIELRTVTFFSAIASDIRDHHSYISTSAFSSMSRQAGLQVLLRFLSQDAKVPLATAMSKIKTLQNDNLTR